MSVESSLYRIRHSKRAKYLQLKVTLRGIELVLPQRISFKHPAVKHFLQEKQEWIERQLHAFHARTPRSLTLPTQLDLPAIGRRYKITYAATSRKNLSLQEINADNLAIIGNVNNYAQCVRILKIWLKAQARQHFSKLLMQLAHEHKFHYRLISVRYMKTRWGSCSSEKNINLCVHALFLPAYLLQYILLHELCHTKIMNHSAAFWRELSKYDAKAVPHAAELKKAGKYLPGWIHE